MSLCFFPSASPTALPLNPNVTKKLIFCLFCFYVIMLPLLHISSPDSTLLKTLTFPLEKVESLIIKY